MRTTIYYWATAIRASFSFLLFFSLGCIPLPKMNDDEKYRRIVMESLEELRKQRDKLNQKIFIAETLAVAFGMDLLEPDDELDDASAAALNEVIRECIWKNAEQKED